LVASVSFVLGSAVVSFVWSSLLGRWVLVCSVDRVGGGDQGITVEEIVKVVLRRFHRSRYRSGPLWFFWGEGL
jgi:hypothetical protein